MIVEPEKYFQYTTPKIHTILNGKEHDFSHQTAACFHHFISSYQTKRLIVLITDATKEKLQAYYDARVDCKVAPLLPASHTGRWYANGFISAYNYCEQYEREHPSADVDFSVYANQIELQNDKQASSHKEPNRDYIVNVGRIEGVRFYVKEHEQTNIGDDTVTTTQTEDSTGEDTPKVNSTGLTLRQNLKPGSSNQRVIDAIEAILKQHRGKQSERTIVGYCIIAIRNLVNNDVTDDVLVRAFWLDYFPDKDINNFKASVYRVLRAYCQKESKDVTNPDEKWGKQKEAILQSVKTQIKKAVTGC